MTRPLDAFYHRLGAADFAGAAALLTDDSTLHVPGRSANTGVYQGREAVMGFVAGASQATNGTLAMSVQRVLDDGEWSVALVTYTARRTAPGGGDMELENSLAHVARLDDGGIAESWLHSRNQYEVDEFWGAGAGKA